MIEDQIFCSDMMVQTDYLMTLEHRVACGCADMSLASEVVAIQLKAHADERTHMEDEIP